MNSRRSTLRVAAAQPEVTDLVSTVRAHARAVDACNADLVVFPELSLTGYHYDTLPFSLDTDAAALDAIVSACARTDAVAVVGAPVTYRDGKAIAMLRVDTSGVSVAHIKSSLGAAENEHFIPGLGPSVIDVGGWRIGLAICKETGDDAHTRALADAGIDVYACGVVHHDHELDEQERRARSITTECGVAVVMASFAGSTGEGYSSTAGNSSIWSPDRRRLACAGAGPGEFAVGDVSGCRTQIATRRRQD